MITMSGRAGDREIRHCAGMGHLDLVATESFYMFYKTCKMIPGIWYNDRREGKR